MSKKTSGWRIGLAVLVSVLFLLPVGLAVWGSLGQVGDVGVPFGTWQRPDFSNYLTVFQTAQMSRLIGNSLLVVILSVPVSTIVASLAAFGIVEQPQPLRRWLLVFAIITMLVPPSAVWLVRFWFFEQIGLLDTLGALMFPALAGGNSLFVLIYFWAWSRIPAELFEAARIDGASFLTRWWQVGLPVVRPATAAVVLLAFTMFWGNFIEPVLFIFDPNKYTLPIGLQLLNQLDSANRPLLLAGAVIAMIPAVLVFAVAQRWFLRGEWVDG